MPGLQTGIHFILEKFMHIMNELSPGESHGMLITKVNFILSALSHLSASSFRIPPFFSLSLSLSVINGGALGLYSTSCPS